MRDREGFVSVKFAWRTFDFRSKIRHLYERARSQVGSLPTADLSEQERDAAVQREARRRKSKEQ